MGGQCFRVGAGEGAGSGEQPAQAHVANLALENEAIDQADAVGGCPIVVQ